MRLNDRVRKKLASMLDDDEIVRAAVLLSHMSGGWASSGGVVHSGGSLLGSAYAVERGIDLDDPTLRAGLLQSWCVATDRELRFFRPSQTAVRPAPGKPADTISLEGTTLHWFDSEGLSTTNRVFHFRFADGTHLLSATMVKARLRRRPYNDEPDLLVAALGAAATRIEQP